MIKSKQRVNEKTQLKNALLKEGNSPGIAD